METIFISDDLGPNSRHHLKQNLILGPTMFMYWLIVVLAPEVSVPAMGSRRRSDVHLLLAMTMQQ